MDSETPVDRGRWLSLTGLFLVALFLAVLVIAASGVVDIPVPVIRLALVIAAIGLVLWVVDSWRTSRADGHGILRSMGQALADALRYVRQLVL